MSSLKSPTTLSTTMAKSEDAVELEKYVAMLASKTASIIIDTRSNIPMTSDCNPQPKSADWFGLAINETQKVRAEMKELTKDHKPVVDKAFGVQVNAVLPSSEEIPLEYWWLWFDASVFEKDAYVKSTVYNRMTILLKSIIVVLRASPINRLIRQNDYFKFTCKMFVGDPDTRNLQSVAKIFKVGPLKTPYGAIYFSGACREAAFSEGSLVSHPLNEHLPREIRPRRSLVETTEIPIKFPSNNSMSPRNSPLLDTRRTGDLGSPKQLRFAPTGINLTEIPIFPKTFAELQYTGAFASPSKNNPESDDETYEIPEHAFAKLVSFPDDDDFERRPIQEKIRPKSILKEVPSRTSSDEVLSGKSDGFSPKLPGAALLVSRFSLDEDDGFSEDELDADSIRPAFAPPKTQAGSHDLAAFYHDCQAAPSSLKFMEKKGVSVSRTVKSLSQKLVGMESELLEFDKFVDDLRVIGGESSWIMTSSH